uniref:Cilia- and flagella-associated protein 45 n=1 Tax=Cairina moschata TaxID=8855 RepID=A0A8C3GNM8_CAIMO
MEPWHRYPVAAPGAIRTRCWAALGPGGPHSAFQPQPPRMFSPLPVPSLSSQSWGCRGTEASPLPKVLAVGLGFIREHRGRSPMCWLGFGTCPGAGDGDGQGLVAGRLGGTPSFLAEPAAVAPRHPHRHPPGCAERPENGAGCRAQARDHPPHHQGLRPRPRRPRGEPGSIPHHQPGGFPADQRSVPSPEQGGARGQAAGPQGGEGSRSRRHFPSPRQGCGQRGVHPAGATRGPPPSPRATHVLARRGGKPQGLPDPPSPEVGSPALPAPWLGKPSQPSWGLSPSREARDGLSSPLCPPQEAVSERKAAAKQRAALQQQKGKLSDLEEEAKERAQYLLQRANRMRMEQEDEIKEFSELILGAKCHMVRDTQILEKRLVAKELEEEERRLAEMMEVERQKANEMQEELERRRKQELIRGRQELVKQIEKNAEERALRAEQRDQETREMLQHLEQLKLEDLKDLERRQEQQKKIQAEIKRINDENQRYKEEQLRQERLADEKILEYQRQKMEREAEFEAEQEKIRREKEKETARLRAMQERAQDHRAEQDALRAKRSQEAAEREWRRKEKEAARRKAELEEQLKRSRLDQIAAREHRVGVQVQQDRNEFERILRAQQEQMEKEKAEAARKAALQRAHAGDVRRQMQEWRQRRAQERAAAFEEFQRLQEEARRRSQRITELKEKKMQELRAAGIPEKYCAQVERRALNRAGAAPGQAQPRGEQSEEQSAAPPAAGELGSA